MSARKIAWMAAVVIGSCLAWTLVPTSWESVALLAFWAGAIVLGLVLELSRALRPDDSSSVPGPPGDARPADGRVDLARMVGVRRLPNPSDPRFGLFQACEAGEAGCKDVRSSGRASPALIGRIALISVFLGKDGVGWTEAEIAQAHASLFRAGTWIEREAARWEAPVNVEVADTYFVVEDQEPDDVELTFLPEGDGLAPFEARAVTKALIDLSRSAARLGFRDAEDWLSRINPRVPADVQVWVLHPRRAGRSLAVPLEQTELAGVSLAVCYAREANVPEPLVGPPATDPVTIVHELLHLFGAADKYGVRLDAFARESVSSRDVMRLDESRLSRLRIDRQTAREIGWDPVV